MSQHFCSQLLNLALPSKVEVALSAFKSQNGITWQSRDYESRCGWVATEKRLHHSGERSVQGLAKKAAKNRWFQMSNPHPILINNLQKPTDHRIPFRIPSPPEVPK